MLTKTAQYGVAELMEAPEQLSVYLEAYIQESEADTAFIVKALGDTARAKQMA